MTVEQHEAWLEDLRDRWRAGELDPPEPGNPPALAWGYLWVATGGRQMFTPCGVTTLRGHVPSLLDAQDNDKATARMGAARAAQLGMAVVFDPSAPDGWRLIHLRFRP